MAALKGIAREWASELREGIAWVIVWKTGRSWNAQAVWLNCEDEKLEPEDLGLARKVLNQDENAVMLNGYYCGRFFEEMTVEDVAAAIRWHYENGYNKLDGSDVFPDEANQGTAEQPAAPAWMDEAQQEDFREICGMIDSIKSGRDFYRVMNRINGGRYSVDVINAAREIKQCFNSAQYEPQQDTPDAAEADNQQEGRRRKPPARAGKRPWARRKQWRARMPRKRRAASRPRRRPGKSTWGSITRKPDRKTGSGKTAGRAIRGTPGQRKASK